MEIFKFFDAYSIRARLFPAIVAAAPALAALVLLIPWKTFQLAGAIATLGAVVLLYSLADFARARGRAIESRLYADHGGMPSVTMFRRSDGTLDAGSKGRYRNFLADKLGTTPPSEEDEQADPKSGDAFYAQCGVWLRENTRDTKKFHLLFNENVTYGFRRNLFGIKRMALAINLVVSAVCVLLLWRTGWTFDGGQGGRLSAVFLVALIHAWYVVLAVRGGAVWDASRAYGRQLILSCEAFLSSAAPPKRSTGNARSKKKSAE